MTNKHQNQSAQYIQNRTNWCWAVACRMVGEQFKRNYPEFDFHILSDQEENWHWEMRLLNGYNILYNMLSA